MVNSVPTAVLVLLASSSVSNAFSIRSFSPNAISRAATSKSSIQNKMSTKDDDENDKNGGLSGSFFNPVPSSSGNDNTGKSSSSSPPPPPPPPTADPFEKNLSDILRRRSKPRASTPSTMGGVPTSKATGFGNAPKIVKTVKTTTSSSSKKSYVAIGNDNKPINNVNNPEYDDQGYTLYANEETGEKSRVFEALVEYPCKFKLKIIGANQGNFAAEMIQIVAESCKVETEDVSFSERLNGKWVSVTVHAPVDSAEMLYTLYENIDRDPRVKFKF